MRRVRWAIASVIAGLVSFAVAAPAAALSPEWEGPTVNLAWDGTTYVTADHSFVGTPVVVPGDRAVRSLRVTNDGPTTGVLRAWVQQVQLLEPAVDDGFYDDLRLDWATASATGAASFRQLAQAERTQIAQTDLGAGESTVVTVGYAFPAGSTTGNRSFVGPREASFVVHLDIRGELPTGPEDPSGPGPAPGATGPWGSTGGGLAELGADALRYALLALVLLGLGLTLAGAARRRRDDRSSSGGCTTSSGG
jgi:hypothetical protein